MSVDSSMARGRRLAAALAALLALLALAFPALAFTPPPLDGHVVDTAGALTREQIAGLDHKLADVRLRTGVAIVAFVAGSLEGESIDDVAYQCFNAWHLGEKGKDNGVLLIVAPHERKDRIETGKGLEGVLTDLQTDDIRTKFVEPALARDRVFDAIDGGTTAIARTLTGEAGPPPEARHARPHAGSQPLSLVKVGVGLGGLFLLILLAIVSPAFRSFLWFFLTMIFFRGRGGGGGGFGGGDGGDGGGSGYSGGGGESGGGGSSGSY